MHYNNDDNKYNGDKLMYIYKIYRSLLHLETNIDYTFMICTQNFYIYRNRE